MIARGRGTMLFTGATAGVKAGPKSISFGPAKFAMRGLAQSLARDLGPKGIHVAWINVDGSIDIPGKRGLKPGLKDDDFLKPGAIAETYWHLAHQDPSAWTLASDSQPASGFGLPRRRSILSDERASCTADRCRARR
jgi:NAD(P)-dependent dehydrogenase (short-subunit alcohol dehydrogenase family)